MNKISSILILFLLISANFIFLYKKNDKRPIHYIISTTIFAILSGIIIVLYVNQDSGKGKIGDNCELSSDCRKGLYCNENICTSKIPGPPTPGPPTPGPPTPGPPTPGPPTPGPVPPTPGPHIHTSNKLSLSSTKLQSIINSATTPFDAIKIFNKIKTTASQAALINYVSLEYDPTQFPSNVMSSGQGKILTGIPQWFDATLAMCQQGDFLIINGDFISMNDKTLQSVQNKLIAGLNIIIVADRWEISGNPRFSSDTSNSKINTDCNCDEIKKTQGWPYNCSGSIGNDQYCTATNNIINELHGTSAKSSTQGKFYLVDRAAAKKSPSSTRTSPLHDHRHMTTFYMPSSNTASVFKGSFNFSRWDSSAGSTNLVTGQKESGLVLTAALNSNPIQSDLIFNYYWLASMSVFCAASLSPPATFTNPGSNASPVFNKLLSMINVNLVDKANDQFIQTEYGSTYELYSIIQQGSSTTYIGGDPSAKISMGYGPPPAPSRTTGGLANPTPWDSSSSMLKRQITDGSTKTTFNSIWPTLSCVSNTMQFMYPYTPIYNKNPVPPIAWRSPVGTTAVNCSTTGSCTAPSAIEYYDTSNIGQKCTKDGECGSNGHCCAGYCAFTGDSLCPTGSCDGCGLPTGEKSAVCKVSPGSPPGCYAATVSGCPADASGNVKCSNKCLCYSCAGVAPPPPTCKVVTENDIGTACFNKDTQGNLIPSNNCYKIDDKSYDCAARVIWAPGCLWIGGLMYKFWKDAGTDSKDKSVYVSMYSSFVDAGPPGGCILNCGASGGGNSGWGTNQISSTQYNFNNANGIDAGNWYSLADSNSVQDVVDFLSITGTELSVIGGQWRNLSPGTGTNGQFSLFQTLAKSKNSTFNYKLYLAQQKQVTFKGTGDTVTTKLQCDGDECKLACVPAGGCDVDDTNCGPCKTERSQRNHTKCYISKKSLASCSGHPYNGGIQDWSGVNEVMLVENCENLCKTLRSNWELEYHYAETIKNASTFQWAKAWNDPSITSADGNLTQTFLTNVTWGASSTKGGLVKL